MTVALAGALTACASSSKSGSSSGGGGGGASSSANSTITIGGVFTRQGPSASPGQYEAATAYFKDRNDHGGIDGHQIKFIAMDDQGNSATAIAAYKKLVKQDHVSAIIVGDDSAFFGAATAVIGSGVPAVGCVYAAPCYTNPSMYPVSAYLVNSFPAAEAQIVKDQKLSSIAFLTVNNGPGKAAADTAKKAISQVGTKIALDTTFDPTTSDFTAFVQRIKDSGAQAIQFIPAAGDIPQFMKAVIQQDFKGPVFTPNYDATYPKVIGSGANDRLYGASAMANLGAGSAGDNAEAVVKKYSPGTSLQGTLFGTASWAAAEALDKAITNLHGQPVTSENIIKQLNTFKNWQGTFNAPLTYGPGANGDPTHCMQITAVKSDAWTVAGGQRLTCFTTSTAPSGS